MASASMMTEAIKGKDRATVDALFQRVHALLTDAGASSADLGKLASLSGVREFPARVKCASLCWHTLNAALAQADAASIRADAGAGVSADTSTSTISTE
jgi:nitrogen fixation NifU-like protein